MRTRKVLLTLLVIVLTFVCCSCVKTDNNIENYADDIERYHADLFMPLLEDVGEYKEANYFVRKDETVFPEYAMQLVVKYDEDVYLKEKERLKTAYTYLDKAQKADYRPFSSRYHFGNGVHRYFQHGQGNSRHRLSLQP